MSYILDALRKSEQERRQTEAPASTQPLANIDLPRRDILSWSGLAVAAGALVALVVVWVWLKPQITNAIGARDKPAATTIAVPLAVSPSTAPPAEQRSAAPELKPHPLLVPPQGSSTVRDLAEEAQVETRPTTAASTRVSPAPSALASAPVAAAPVPASSMGVEPIKFLRSMSPDFQRSLPELVVNIHIYAPRAADRILYINNRQYQAGDRVGDGVRVEEIVEDGAVLSFQGQRFKLPRPR